MKTKCNNCKKEFNIILQSLILSPAKIDNGEVIEYYFVCKKCNTKYHSYFENKESLSIQKLIDDTCAIIRGIEQSKIYNVKTKEEKIKVRHEELEKLRNKKKLILEELEKKYKDYVNNT
jgi:hypothetical protein